MAEVQIKKDHQVRVVVRIIKRLAQVKLNVRMYFVQLLYWVIVNLLMVMGRILILLLSSQSLGMIV